MQEVGKLEDIVARPGRYGSDLRKCSALSFSGGSVFYAAATGAVGGFALGAMPAMAVQALVTGWIGYEQTNATYNGEGYNTPFKRLAVANWVTAAALVCGAVTAGGPLAVTISVLPAAIMAGWGWGDWDYGRIIDRIEKLTEAGKTAQLNEEQIKKKIETDPTIVRLSKHVQKLYGLCDSGAIINAAVKGEDIRAVVTQTLSGLTSWDALVPLAITGIGLVKSFSKGAREVVDRLTPGFVKGMLKTSSGEVTPNRYYAAGYIAAGLFAFAGALMPQEAVQVATSAVYAKALCMAVAYGAWAHAYITMDEQAKAPVSADRFRVQNRRPAPQG